MYNFTTRVACAGLGGQFHLELDGVGITGAITVPDTGGWGAWQALTLPNINLPSGLHVLRLVMDTEGPTGFVGNFDWFGFQS